MRSYNYSLLLGRSGTGKTHAMLAAMGAANRPQILIVPEQHSHDMERQLCAVGGNAISLHAEVLSFTRLANRVFSAHGGLAAPTLDQGGRLLLLCTALKSVADQLKVYQRPSRKPAFLSSLLATVDELKSCCITPEQLWEAGSDTGGGEGDKLTDLSLIFGAYEAMTAQRWADPRDKLTRLAQTLTQTGRQRLTQSAALPLREGGASHIGKAASPRRGRCRRPPFYLSGPVHSGARPLSPSPIRPDTLRPSRTRPSGLERLIFVPMENRQPVWPPSRLTASTAPSPAMRPASHWTGTPPLRLMRPSTNTAT